MNYMSKDMSSYRKYIWIAIFMAMFVGCDKDDKPVLETPETADPVILSLELSPAYGNKTINFNTDEFVTAANDTIQPNKFRFLMSKIQLVKMDNTTITFSGKYGFVNLGDNAKVNLEFPEVPAGNYNAIKFSVGLDSAINHGDPSQWPSTHPLSPLVNGLHWGWQGGYIFMSHEGNFKNQGIMDQYTFHIATLPFAIEIEMPVNYIHTAGAADVIAIKCDLEKYFSGVNTYSLKTDIPASHSGSMDAVYINKLRENVALMFSARVK